MANNPWVLPDGFDADVRKALKALKSALNKSGAKIPDAAFTQLRLGNIEAFLAFVDWDKIRGGMEGFEAILVDAAQKAGTSTFTLGGVDNELLFDLIDERAVLYAQERVGQLIVEITDQMRETVRQTIASAERGEMTYQMAALQLQNTIPLTTRDAGAVTKFTEKQFQRFMREGLSEARARVKAQNMAAQYAAKLLDARTRTIARTEIIDASMSGRYLGWEAGVTAGYISNDSVKEWIAEPDACPICRELDGKLIGWNQEWEFPEGVSAGSTNRMPPAHPNCRCSVVILPPDYAENVFTPQSGGEMPEEASEFLKHLTGQHDQASHGRKGPIKAGFQNWNSQVSKLIESAEQIDSIRGNALQTVFIEAAGFNGKPQLLSQEEFDAIESESLYRGVTDPAFLEDYKESLVQYAGVGAFGNGTYSTNVKDSTIYYTGAESKAEIATRTMEMKLMPDANVVSFDNPLAVQAYAKNLTQDFIEQYKASGKNPQEVQEVQWSFDNAGDWTNIAIMQGIDAIRFEAYNNPQRGEYFTVILNRGKVAINNG